MIAIVDYGVGNLKNVYTALTKLGLSAQITSNVHQIDKAKAVVLPGVGAFKDAMMNLDKYKLIPCIDRNVRGGKPFLGICLGMQLLFEKSYENGLWDGLGYLEGEIIKFNTELTRPNSPASIGGGFQRAAKSSMDSANIQWELNLPLDEVSFNKGLKVPHMGWNNLRIHKKHPLAKNIGEGEYAYFVHSYYLQTDNWDNVVLYCDYGSKVPAVVAKDNIYGMQFHPEKSSVTGNKLLNNFKELVK